jgi:SnoaL-like protein
MTATNSEVVRGLLTRQGDVLDEIRKTLSRLGPDPREPAEAITTQAEAAGWVAYDPQIVWDMSATGMGGVNRGPREVALWWSTVAASVDSYEYDVLACDDVGDWVLSAADVTAAPCKSPPQTLRVHQIWQLRDGKVLLMRAFLSEDDAKAALREAGARA